MDSLAHTHRARAQTGMVRSTGMYGMEALNSAYSVLERAQGGSETTAGGVGKCSSIAGAISAERNCGNGPVAQAA